MITEQRPKRTRRTQAERSQTTQKKILDATLDCLMKYGLRDTSTVDVTRRAGVSRGALLHHYPTKELLLQQTLQYLLRAEVDDILRMADEVDSGRMGLDDFLADLWERFSGRLYMISLEYIVAARTDPALREVLAEVAWEFNTSLDALWERLMLNSDLAPRERRLALNSTLCLMRGMSAQGIWRDDPQFFREMLEFWKQTLVKAGIIGPPQSQQERSGDDADPDRSRGDRR